MSHPWLFVPDFPLAFRGGSAGLWLRSQTPPIMPATARQWRAEKNVQLLYCGPSRSR